MEIAFAIEGVGERRISLQVGAFSGPRVLIDGQPAQRGEAKNSFVVERAERPPAVVRIKSGVFGATTVDVDGETEELAPALRFYEYIWIGLPLLLVVSLFGGGALGAGVGAGVSILNSRVFRSASGNLQRYGSTGLITIAGVVAYVVVASVIAGDVTPY